MDEIGELQYAQMHVQIVKVMDIPIIRRVGLDGLIKEGPPKAMVTVSFQGMEHKTSAKEESVSPQWGEEQDIFRFPYVKGSNDETESLRFSIVDTLNETQHKFIGSGACSPNHWRSSADGMDTNLDIEDVHRRKLIDPLGAQCRIYFRSPITTSLVRILVLKAHDCFGVRGKRLAPDDVNIRSLRAEASIGNDQDTTAGPVRGLNDDPVWLQTMSLKVGHMGGKPKAWVAELKIVCKETLQTVAVARINLSTATKFGESSTGWFRLFGPAQRGASVAQKGFMSRRDLWRVNTPKISVRIRWGFRSDKMFDRDTRERADLESEEQLQLAMDLTSQALLPKLNEGEQIALSNLYRQTVKDPEKQPKIAGYGDSYYGGFMKVSIMSQEEVRESVGAWLAEDHEATVRETQLAATSTVQTPATWFSSLISSFTQTPSSPLDCFRGPVQEQVEEEESVAELEPEKKKDVVGDDAVEDLYDSVWIAGTADKDGHHKFEP